MADDRLSGAGADVQMVVARAAKGVVVARATEDGIPTGLAIDSIVVVAAVIRSAADTLET